ncbi:TIGR03617 family F420-dependent LLM class oxidoreductase [Pseudonocardia spinosispora]|uniref:TIGR03617 family F420-dependent LLM class oxidoreductase n=1 Tax=Pseudonocardia spinosispora TaxID=103441 RepID=UPI00040321A5|nr:TIGR03617 family F420-dependent LLM class oxidoreductase [Pseudonocardia spinosispora]
MKVDATLRGDAGDWDRARRAEERGYDAVWLSEVKHDPFPSLAVVATRTERVGLGTAIALAFARNPMSTAILANDLQLYSRGRFMLGLGSQVRPHITKRFSMPWSAPAERMREYILAVRAIWESWSAGVPVDFRGTHYSHTLMTPMFDPGPNPYGAPPIILAGVGPKMTEVAGEVADGFFVHGFTTERYLRETTVPALLEGRRAGGSTDLAGFQVSGLPFVVTGEGTSEIEVAAAAVRRQIAFYGSTPSYWPVLEAHGWGDIGRELNVMSKRGQWNQMGDRIDDQMLDAFAVVAPPADVAGQVRQRYGDLFTRCGLYAPYPLRPESLELIVRGIQAGRSPERSV